MPHIFAPFRTLRPGSGESRSYTRELWFEHLSLRVEHFENEIGLIKTLIFLTEAPVVKTWTALGFPRGWGFLLPGGKIPNDWISHSQLPCRCDENSNHEVWKVSRWRYRIRWMSYSILLRVGFSSLRLGIVFPLKIALVHARHTVPPSVDHKSQSLFTLKGVQGSF
jgi:hypothetical protein